MFSNEIYGYASLSTHVTEMGGPARFLPPPPPTSFSPPFKTLLWME